MPTTYHGLPGQIDVCAALISVEIDIIVNLEPSSVYERSKNGTVQPRKAGFGHGGLIK